MERRDFLKLASVAGLGVVGGSTFLSEVKAADPYTGPLNIMIHAGGGWDPTSFCDPKGAESAMETNPMNTYLQTDIIPVGNHKVAPFANAPEFFNQLGSRLLVVNGIDVQTNSHDTGTRCVSCGMLSENKPALNALIAGAYGPDLPMAYITNGGYDSSQGVVAVTRVGSIGALQRIAFPNKINPDQEDSALYHNQGAIDILSKARAERIQSMQAKQQLPRLSERMGLLYLARSGQNQLQELAAYLPDDLEGGLRGQAQIIVAAMRAGVCISANMAAGGFDTHGNHDQQHADALTNLFDGAMYLDTLLQDPNIAGPDLAGRMRVMMVSDFGRTPRYNDGQGKDHHPISSWMFWGNGIKGNRVFGASTHEHDALEVDPQTGAEKKGGVIITPGLIHKELRKIFGVYEHAVSTRFPIPDEGELPGLFA